MGLFDNNRRDKRNGSLSKQDIENEIIERKKQIGQLKKEITASKSEISKDKRAHNEKLRALDEKQVVFVESVEAKKEKLNKELKKLEAKQARYKNTHEARQDEINKKINDLKKKKKRLLEQQYDVDKSYFEKRKKTIDKSLQTLRATKKKQDEDFENKMSIMKDNYEELLSKKKNEYDDVVNAKQILKEKTDISTAELKAKENEAKKKHQERLKRLADSHRETMNEIMAEEENKLKARQSVLNDLCDEADSLTAMRDSLIKELESTRIRNEHEYETIFTRYEAENAKLLKDNDILNNDLESKQKRLEEQVENEKFEYDNKLAELDYLFSTLTEKKNATNQEIRNQASAKDAEIKAKYAEYLSGLEEDYQTRKNKLDEELKAIEYNLVQEEEQLKNRNEFLKERYKNRDAQYRKNIEDYKTQVKEAEAGLASFENECTTRIANFKKDLEKLKNDNALALQDQDKHYSNIISNTKKDFSIRRKKINEDISQTRIDIENINVEIEKLKKDLETYKANYVKKRNTLDKEHAAYLSKIASKKADIEKSIASLNDLMKEKEDKHAKNISELEEKKQQISSEHEEKIAVLKSDHSKKINTLNAKHADALAKAERNHNVKIEKITKKYEKDVYDANSAYALKEKEYEDEKAKLEVDLDNLHDETELKINQLQSQKAEILATIENLRKDIDAKQAEYDAEVKQLESEHIAKLDEMARAQDEALTKITSDYEGIPSTELTAVRADYEAKQKEYNDNSSEVALKKQSIDDDYQSVETAMSLERQKVDDDLAVVSREYDRVKAEAEKLEADLNSELTKRKQELQDYKDDLSKQIQSVKDEKSAELARVNSQLEDEYAAVEKQYVDKQEAISRQYEEEIKAHQAELNAKYENLNSLVNEINQRRDNTEREYIAKYNAVADVTKVVQQELDEIVNQNNLKRSELAASIEQKKADNNAEIENIKNNYNDVLADKKKAYDDYINDVREKCNALRKEISDMEKQKENDTANLEKYANEKLTAMNHLEGETQLYVENIKNKMDSLAAQQLALQAAHSKRVATIKAQIASTMSDYDNLLRTRMQVVADASGDDIESELTSKAKAFRERLNALEDSHKQVLTDLNNKRNETLDKIGNEIEQLDISMPEKLQSYENEIKSISVAYDTLLRDEEAKQNAILDLIKKSKQEQDDILDENKTQLADLDKELVQRKNELAKQSKDNMKQAYGDFNTLTSELKSEFEKLVKDKNAISKQLMDLARKFEKIDDEVFRSTVELKDKYMSELMNVRKIFEEKRIKKQQELSALDTMSGEVNDLFKKF